jgi:hypothetical protein
VEVEIARKQLDVEEGIYLRLELRGRVRAG